MESQNDSPFATSGRSVDKSITDSPFAPNANLGEQRPALLGQSKLGTASFILGLVSVLIIMGLVLVVIGIALLPPKTSDDLRPMAGVAVAGFMASGILGAIVLPVIGACLGVAGLSRNNCRRSFAVAGLIGNAVTLIFAISTIAIYFLLLKAVEHAISC